jgi:hypothetical protein
MLKGLLLKQQLSPWLLAPSQQQGQCSHCNLLLLLAAISLKMLP